MEYSLDLRERVIAFVEQGGKKVDASVLFNVSRPTINIWIKLKQETGSLKKPPLPPRSWRKINPDELKAYVADHPDMILDEYAAHFNVTNSGLWRALDRIDLTRKKKPHSTRNETKKSEHYILKR